MSSRRSRSSSLVAAALYPAHKALVDQTQPALGLAGSSDATMLASFFIALARQVGATTRAVMSRA